MRVRTCARTRRSSHSTAPGEIMTPATAAAPEVHAFPGNEALAGAIADTLGTVATPVAVDRFPDGEARVRVGGDRTRRSAVLVCSLEHSDEKMLPLLFAAGALHARGAPRVGLVAPYLAYMRQDRAFHEGEVVSAIHFARLLSVSVDWLVTVEPHLHRIASLDAIYSIPACAVHVSDVLANWIAANVANPLVIGPDDESRQWAHGRRCAWRFTRSSRATPTRRSFAPGPRGWSPRTRSHTRRTASTYPATSPLPSRRSARRCPQLSDTPALTNRARPDAEWASPRHSEAGGPGIVCACPNE